MPIMTQIKSTRVTPAKSEAQLLEISPLFETLETSNEEPFVPFTEAFVKPGSSESAVKILHNSAAKTVIRRGKHVTVVQIVDVKTKKILLKNFFLSLPVLLLQIKRLAFFCARAKIVVLNMNDTISGKM